MDELFPYDNFSELNNNKLTQIPDDTFVNLPSLRRLKLIGSNIVCDCGLFEKVKRWKGRGLDVDLTCHGPSQFTGRKVINLSERELNCSEYIRNVVTRAFGFLN